MNRVIEMLAEADGSKTPEQVKQFKDFQRKGAEARKRAGGTGGGKPVAQPKAQPKKKAKKKVRKQAQAVGVGAKVGRAANGAAKATATSPIIKMFGG